MLTIGRVVKGMVLYRVIGMLGNMDLSVMSRLVVSIPVLGKTFLDIKIQTKGCFMQFKIQIRIFHKIQDLITNPTRGVLEESWIKVFIHSYPLVVSKVVSQLEFQFSSLGFTCIFNLSET